jgi:sugar lactone lactonase YvrE
MRSGARYPLLVVAGLLGLVFAAWTLAGCESRGVAEVVIPSGTPPVVVIPSGTPPVVTLQAAEMVRAYDSAAQEQPEGIAVDAEGNVYASLARLGQVRKIAPDGSETTLLDLGGPKPLGLAADAEGTVYLAMFAPETENHGVHRIEPDGTSQRLPGSEAIVHPNGLTLDRERTLYISDSEAGTLWRIEAGGTAELWLEHALLEATGDSPDYPPIGANGVAHWQDLIYVANLEQGLMLRVPVREDGQAGEPEVIAEGIYGMDGIAVDLWGRVYAALGIQNKVVQIDPADGTVSDVATRDDGLDVPASLAFGVREGEGASLFVSNYAVGWFSTKPGVVRLELGLEGYPLP